MGRFDILHGGFCQNISITLTAGIHDLYYTDIAKHLSFKTPISNSEANYHMQTLRSSQFPINKAAPDVEELFQIIKIAIEQNNAVGCNTSNVGFIFIG